MQENILVKKVFNKLMNVFESSYRFNILAWIARIVSFPVIVVLFCTLDNQVSLPLIIFAALILLIEWIFFTFKIKESNYKSVKFFETLKITISTYDRFCRNRLILKTSFFALFVLVPSAFEFYFIVSFFVVTVMANSTIFKNAVFPNSATYDSSQSIVSMDNNCSGAEHVAFYESNLTTSIFDDHTFPSDISTDPPNYGTPGFDVAGIYTGSSTAIGGISN